MGSTLQGKNLLGANSFLEEWTPLKADPYGKGRQTRATDCEQMLTYTCEQMLTYNLTTATTLLEQTFH